MNTRNSNNWLSWKAFGLMTIVALCLNMIYMPNCSSQENLRSAPVRLYPGRDAAVENKKVLAPTAVANANDCTRLLQLVEERMYDPVVMTKLVTLAAQAQCPLDKDVYGQVDYVNSLIAKVTGDPYTYVMNPTVARDQNAAFAGTTSLYKAGVGGIGVGFRYDQRLQVNGKDKFDGHIWRIYPNSPASGAGLRDTDVIIEVDGHNVIGGDAEDIQSSMRGALNSSVSITVMRDNQPVTFMLVRRDVQTYNVFVKDVGDGYFAILVSDFTSRQTPDRIRQAIESTYSRARGYIIDIRNNGGGLIDSGVGSAELFIRDGVIICDRERRFADQATTDPAQSSFIRNIWSVGQKSVYRRTDDNGRELSTSEHDRQPFSVGGKPVVVLINGNTASAAEIFTSSLKGNRRDGALAQGATILGDPSFGKGIGQINDAGPDATMVRVTYLRYYTVSGVWLGDGHDEKHPLLPDIIVSNIKDAMPYSAEDKQLQEGVHELERENYKSWQALQAPVSVSSSPPVAVQASGKL